MPALLIYSIGFLAQGFFSARILVQWIMSERSRRVVSPSIYWICSLAGSILLFTYGWLRDDFSIILGQFISYYIYIWNLNIKGVWNKVPSAFRMLISLLPLIALIFTLQDASTFVDSFFQNENIPSALVVFGSLGQVIFTLRFVYQWYYSHRRQESILPVGFWIISLVGSGIIVTYGMIRLDPVLILGQSVGFIAYIRNMILFKQSRKKVL
ncbi:lipid-A-disaccharide synthase N-terminal domain-containing protein [Phocaeicola abscessus]|uniref:lipid-A-disaccharide synthase N-terminal domain-containing protein n=1 Tax=Phocaeicola abscessus TaxID=555313 RepID=UPI0003860ED8|nr:lipid-A-disaccharide synthase N-terminal domain-containing protein [Phocaeicola abscessus]EPT33308.1 lipid A Biosynthesis N-terminal domain protein [Bacteroidetes bacterium oral taxon 272 str. F0290]